MTDRQPVGTVSRRRLLQTAATVALGVAGVGAIAEEPLRMTEPRDIAYVPPLTDDGWEAVAAEDVGWDATQLDATVDWAGERNSTALIVLHGGRILTERYWRGWSPHRAAAIASCQKSIVAMLTGVAQHEGHLNIMDRVSTYLGGGWTTATREQEARITIRHLLTMTSGLDESLAHESEPGAAWYYNTPAYWRTKAVIEQAASASITDFARTRLWDRIGMQDSSWVGEILNGQQHRASVRDMARFGLLMLRGGVWGGERILPDAAFITDALRPSQPLNESYGYLWWLNSGASFLLPGPSRRRNEGRFIPAAPSDMVMALGAGDKKVYVVPSLDLVVCRHGDAAGLGRAEARSSFDNDLWQRLMLAAPPR